MAKSPFKLKSGNSPLFKMMGSSPMKQKGKTYKKAYREIPFDPDQTDENPPPADEYWRKKDKWGRIYGEKSLSGGEAKFTKAAKAWNMKTYGTHNPTADAKKAGMSKKDLAAQHTSKTQMAADKAKYAVTSQEQADAIEAKYVPKKAVPKPKVETEVKEVTPKSTSRKERKQEKTARKSSGRLSRKEIKYEKLASKAESALAEGKGRKAKRLAKRASRKLRKKGVRTSDEGVGKTSDRMIDIGLG